MGKKIKTLEQIDLETCQVLMENIENAARGLADYGSNFMGRSWVNDKESNAQISTIYQDTVQSLRAAYRRLSEAEELLEHELGAVAPPVKRSIVRRMLLLGDGA